jgi:hypothetical protein
MNGHGVMTTSESASRYEGGTSVASAVQQVRGGFNSCSRCSRVGEGAPSVAGAVE